MAKIKTVELDGTVYAEVKDGKVVMVEDDGKEFTLDAAAAAANVHKATNEAKEYRLKLRQVEEKLKKFEGIENPEKAMEALRTVENLDEKTQAKIEELKTSLNQAWESKIQEKENALKELESQLYKATVTTKFSTSPVVKKLVLPPDIAAEYFGKHFQPDGTAKDNAGNVIYSKERPGEPADFDEALEVLIDSYPNKESILKAKLSGGSGGHSGGGPGDGGGKELHGRDAIAAGLKERGIA